MATTAGKGCVTVMLPGKAMASFTPKAFQEQLRRWKDKGARPTARRLDLTRDGLGATVDQVEVAFRGSPDLIRCRATRKQFGLISSEDGLSFTVGDRSSNRFMRVYDLHGPVRVELECKGDYAEFVGDRLIETPWEEWGDLIVGVIAEFIDFGTTWWDDFVGAVARVRMAVQPAVEQTLDRMREWIERQVAPTLATLVAAGGGDLSELVGFVGAGRRRMRPEQWALVPAWVGVRS
jgi:DNA relaxase NicK